MSSQNPWKCTQCRTVVFIPANAGIKGGVCTQQRRGCAGEIVEMGEAEARAVRATIAARGIREQPWLTLIFAAPAPATGTTATATEAPKPDGT